MDTNPQQHERCLMCGEQARIGLVYRNQANYHCQCGYRFMVYGEFTSSLCPGGMEMNDKWVAWERFGRGLDRNKVAMIRKESEGKPKYFSLSRPATEQEVSEEIARRETREREAATIRAFESRQDYRDAKVIRGILEWMTPEDNPLGALTPEEWAELRKKLEDWK